jgi:hypothetical protein
MKSLFTNLIMGLPIAGVLIGSSATAQNVALKADYVFAVNSSLMERCAADYEFNTALANNATTEDDTLAKRDLIRIFRGCEDKFRRPQHMGFSYLAVEALNYGECKPDTCPVTVKEKLAEKTFEISDKFIKEYAEILREELQDSCLRDHDFQCAEEAVSSSNSIMRTKEHDWLSSSPDGRVYAMADDKTGDFKPIPRFSEFVDHVQEAVDKTFPDGINRTGEITADLSAELETLGYDILEDGVSVEELSDDVQIWAKNDIVKLNFTAGLATCSWVALNYKSMDALEVTVDRKLIRGFDTQACDGPDLKKISIAFEWS